MVGILKAIKQEQFYFNVMKTAKKYQQKYEDMLGNYQLVITNVHEQYLYNHTFLIKLVGF